MDEQPVTLGGCNFRRLFVYISGAVFVWVIFASYVVQQDHRGSRAVIFPPLYDKKGGVRIAGEGRELGSSNRTCTLPLLREIHLKHGRFPSNVSWNNARNGQKTLVSSLCKFHALRDRLGKCLLKRSINYVAILGDSNGGRMSSAFREAIGYCRLVRNESEPRIPRKSYYQAKDDDPRALQVHQRHCGCMGTVYSCSVGGKNITVEYVAMEYLWDTEITSLRLQRYSKNFPVCGKTDKSKLPRTCPESHSTLQFILKEYFSRKTSEYPQLILHLGNSHDQNTLTAGETLMASEMVGRMYDLYVPKTSKVVFFSKPYEEMHKKPKLWLNVRFEGKYRVLEQVKRMNNAIGLGLDRALREPNSNIFVFFDLFAMGEGVARVWALDGVHKQPPWYQAVVKYFSMAFCAS